MPIPSYAPLVSVGSYCIVFDTIIEDMPAEMFPDRPWSPGITPKRLYGNTSRPTPSSRSIRPSRTNCPSVWPRMDM
jgi:cephalosporin hydroxylase